MSDETTTAATSGGIMRPLRHKVMIPLLTIGIVTSIVVGLFAYFNIEAQLMRQLRYRAIQLIDTISVAGESVDEVSELQRVVLAMSATPDVSLIVVVDSNQKIVASSRSNWIGRSGIQNNQTQLWNDLHAVIEGRERFSRMSETTEFDFIAPLSLPTVESDAGYGKRAAVAVRMDARAVRWDLMHDSVLVVLGVLGIVLLLCFAAWALLRQHVLAPVDRIAVAVESRRSGDHETLLRAAPDDELGELARSLDDAFVRIDTHQQQLTEARDAAEAANRAKSDFLAAMSHEIRTPMNGVIGFSNLLLESQMTAEQTDFARTIRSSAENLLIIINDILDFSKVESGRLELEDMVYDLDDATGEVLELLATRAEEKGIELALQIAPEVPRTLIGDCGRVRQVLLNLVGNAMKFTNRGYVHVEATLDKSIASPTPRLLISVTDTGIGIPEDRQHLLFQRFSQADSSTTRRYGGTGLGLAISKSLVELMGGEIGVRSTAGKGSTFWFRLPLRVAETSIETPSLPFRQDARVLVVDDLDVNRRVLSAQLTSWGIPHDCVDSAMAALATLHRAVTAGVPYQIALIDHMMPDIDGVALAGCISADPALRKTRMVMLTSASQQGSSQRYQDAGFFAVMVKPVVRSKHLLNVLHSAMRSNARAISSVAESPVTASGGAPPVAVTKRVLLAEDNLVNAKLATRMLERLGCSVDVASNGREALEMVRSMPFDVVFMDCQMPEMDGFEATRAIREWERTSREGKSPETRLPIIALTANAMQGDKERCLEAGMDGYVTKPINRTDLQQALAGCGNVAPAVEIRDEVGVARNV